MKIAREGNELKVTVEEQDTTLWKGLDRNGNCFFKFDFSDKSGLTVKVRVPSETGFAMILLMKEELVKFFRSNNWKTVLNSKEEIEFQKLKEALVDNKDLESQMSLRKSQKYNLDYFEKYGEKINEIELAQEEAITQNISAHGRRQKELYLKEKKLLVEPDDSEMPSV